MLPDVTVPLWSLRLELLGLGLDLSEQLAAYRVADCVDLVDDVRERLVDACTLQLVGRHGTEPCLERVETRKSASPRKLIAANRGEPLA
jgi:hypothetical protein